MFLTFYSECTDFRDFLQLSSGHLRFEPLQILPSYTFSGIAEHRLNNYQTWLPWQQYVFALFFLPPNHRLVSVHKVIFHYLALSDLPFCDYHYYSLMSWTFLYGY